MSKIKKHEYLERSKYYESGSVGTRARSDKTCEYCGEEAELCGNTYWLITHCKNCVDQHSGCKK